MPVVRLMHYKSVLAVCVVVGLSGCQESIEPFGSIEEELARLATLEGLTCESRQRRIANCSYQGKTFYITVPGTRVERISIPRDSSSELLRALGPYYGFTPNQLARMIEAKPGIRITREPFMMWQEGPVVRLSKS